MAGSAGSAAPEALVLAVIDTAEMGADGLTAVCPREIMWYSLKAGVRAVMV